MSSNQCQYAQSVSVLCHPHNEKCVSLCSDRASCVSVCALCLLSCYWAPVKRAWLHPLSTHLSSIYNIYIDKILLSLCFSRLNSLRSLSLSSQQRWLQFLNNLCGPSVDSFHYAHISHAAGSAERTQHSRSGLGSSEESACWQCFA